MTAQMMPVAKQEEIVIRISGFTTHYLKSISGSGDRFNKHTSDNVWIIVDEINGKYKKQKGLNNPDILCRFDSEEEAKKCLVKIYKTHYKKHKENLPEGYIEIVRISVSVKEEVLGKYDFDALEGLEVSYIDVLEEFEDYFINTAFAKKTGITRDVIALKRKENLTGYLDLKIDNFFKSWCELNDK